jgi:hypothetical protein
MINLPFIKTHYVRVFIGRAKGEKGDQYLTLGPYPEKYANTLMKKYLSTGICSWIEKIE